MGSDDFGKLSLLHFAIGFQLYAVDMSQRGFYGDDDEEPKDDAIKAFLIIGFIVYCVTFIMSCLLNFGDLKGNKIASIATCILGFVAIICLVIGIAIYGAENSNVLFTYTMTTYVMAGVLGLIGSIFVAVQLAS